MKIKITLLIIISVVSGLLTTQAQKMWISGIYNHNTISYYENGKLTEIGTVWANTGDNAPTGQESNGKHMVAYGEFKSYQNSWYFDMEEVHLSATKLYSGTFRLFPNNKCPILGMNEGRLYMENDDSIEIASKEEVTEGDYISVGQAEFGTSICDGKRIPTYYILEISTKAYGPGQRPYYMSKDTKESIKNSGGAYIQDSW